MDATQININTAVLRQILKLTERKEALIIELSKIEKEIEDSFKGKTPFLSSAQKSLPVSKKFQVKKTRNKQRGKLKDIILVALAEAGASGIKVTALAEQLGIKTANIHTWFSTIGKKISEIERIAPGRFRLREAQPQQVPIEAVVEEKTESSSEHSLRELENDSQESLHPYINKDELSQQPIF